MQLDAMLRSFRAHCRDATGVPIAVLCTSSTAAHQISYRELSADFPDVTLLHTQDFKRQTEELLALADAVVVVTDDTLFVRDFDLAPCAAALRAHPDALGVSLRLGSNTRSCYATGRPQAVPAFEPVAEGLVGYAHGSAEGDFAQPFDLSATVFRAPDLLTLLGPAPFIHPTALQDALVLARGRISRPRMLCHEASVAFTAPINRVQTTHATRVGNDPSMSTDVLLERYIQGDRIDLDALVGFVPTGCDQEIRLPITGLPAEAGASEAAASPTPTAAIEPYEPTLRLVETAVAGGRLLEAHAALMAYLARNPHEPTAVIDLATVLAAGNQVNAAQVELEGLLERQPANAEARRKLGAVLLAKGDADGTVAVVHPLMSQDSRNPDTLVLLGEAAAALGFFDKAISFLRAAADAGAPQPSLRTKIAQLESAPPSAE